MDLWLSYGHTTIGLAGYADAGGSMAKDRHTISGYALIMGELLVLNARNHLVVGECVATTHAAKEALWLRSLILDTTLSPTTLFSDIQSPIALTKDHQYHAHTNHIDIRYHSTPWIVKHVYCPTDDMIADMLTKARPFAGVKHFAAELGLASPYDCSDDCHHHGARVGPKR